MGTLFGTDGVRGIANKKLSTELAFKLGRAGAYVLARDHQRPKIVIGKDTRISGDMLESALAAGICSVGADVIRLGVIPTPGVAYLARELGAQAAVVISASHNPMEDNGIKFFGGNGYKLPDALEDEIEELILSGRELPRPIGAAVGRIEDLPDALLRYGNYLKKTAGTDLSGLKIVVDCANGAVSALAPQVLADLGAEVIPIFYQPDGININAGCGSTHPEPLMAAVLAHGADMGIAHDGDADRMLAVDEKGRLVDGDQIMVICALHLMEQGRLKGNKIVVTVMSNLGLHLALQKKGIEILQTKVGDRYVLEKMVASGASLGGEQSGHVIFSDYNTTGDGLGTALQLLQVMAEAKKPLSQLAGQMVRLPQVLVNIRVKDKEGWDENLAIHQSVKKAERILGDSGRVLVRASGTEPLIRVMAEGVDAVELQKLVDEMVAVVIQELGGAVI